MHPDRDVLFANEAFAVGMLQAVSGGAVVAALSQSDTIVKIAGRLPFLTLVTAAALALALAVLSAYWRHQYKMWDVKAEASRSRQDEQEANQRQVRAGRYLRAMRIGMATSVGALLVGLATLVAALWVNQVNVGPGAAATAPPRPASQASAAP